MYDLSRFKTLYECAKHKITEMNAGKQRLVYHEPTIANVVDEIFDDCIDKGWCGLPSLRKFDLGYKKLTSEEMFEIAMHEVFEVPHVLGVLCNSSIDSDHNPFPPHSYGSSCWEYVQAIEAIAEAEAESRGESSSLQPAMNKKMDFAQTCINELLAIFAQRTKGPYWSFNLLVATIKMSNISLLSRMIKAEGGQLIENMRREYSVRKDMEYEIHCDDDHHNFDCNLWLAVKDDDRCRPALRYLVSVGKLTDQQDVTLPLPLQDSIWKRVT
jgi:hypothetical protein